MAMQGWKNKKEDSMSWKDLSQAWHFVEKWAETKPEVEAIVFEDDRLSWKDFKKKMDGVAGAYLEVGVQRETVLPCFPWHEMSS